jgi:parafibromin
VADLYPILKPCGLKNYEHARKKKQKFLEIKVPSLKVAKQNARYHLVNDLKSVDDWARVVAIFTTGQAWSLKGLKWDTPASIFTHLKGFHLHFADEPITANIGKWAVEPLAIRKQDRYEDRTLVTQFWKKLGRWIEQNPACRHLDY